MEAYAGAVWRNAAASAAAREAREAGCTCGVMVNACDVLAGAAPLEVVAPQTLSKCAGGMHIRARSSERRGRVSVGRRSSATARVRSVPYAQVPVTHMLLEASTRGVERGAKRRRAHS